MIEVNEVVLHYKKKTENYPTITSSSYAADVFKDYFDDNTIEYKESMKVMLLNRINEVLAISTLSEGGTTGTIIDKKVLFATALKANAHAIILCHNHPSGNTKPSDADIKITNEIKKAADLFDIQLLDHIILTKNKYLSMADEGII